MLRKDTAIAPPPELSGPAFAFTELAPSPMVVVDGPNHIVRYVNPAFCQLLDSPAHHLVGKSFCELLPEKDVCSKLLDRVLRTKKPDHHTEQEASKPHPIFWSYSMWPIMTGDRLVGIMIQVTETAEERETTLQMNEALTKRLVREHEILERVERTKHAELIKEVAARQEAARELAAKGLELAEKARLLDLTEDAIIVRDLQDNISLWNKGAQRLFGWTSEEVMGKHLHTLLQTEFPEPMEQIVEKLYRDGHYRGEVVQVARDGRRIPSLCRWVLDRDTESILTSYTDITEGERIKEALRANKATLDFALGAAQVGDWDLDLATDVARRSFRHDQAFGYTEPVKEWGFATFIEHVYPEDRADIERQFHEAVREQKPWHFECRVIWPDGSVHWIAAHGSIYRTPEGKPTRMLGIVANITERKKAEEALRESAELMRLATETTGVGIWEWNLKTGHVRWNEQLFRIYGMTPTPDGLIPYDAWAGCVFPEDIDRQNEILKETARCLGQSRREFRIRRADNQEPRYIESVEAVRLDDKGKAAWVVGTNLDVTERKRAEEALRASEERFRTAAGAVSSIIWTNDRSGQMEGEQVGWSKFTGQTYEEYQGYGWAKAVHPDDAQPTIDAWNQAVAEKRMFEFEHRVRRHDGQVRLCSIRAVPVLGDDGSIREWVGVHTDITESKRAEEALRQSEELFRAMADNIPPLAWMANADGWIFWYNKRWHDYTGTTPEEMEGWGWEKVHEPKELQRMLPGWKAALASGQPWEDTFPLRRRDGKYGWFLSRAFPIRDASGNITRWFGTNMEISELRETQQALAAANELLGNEAAQLEKLVDERTAKLSETVGDLEAFSYGITHDLRAPLRAMQNFSNILEEDYSPKLDDEAKDYLRRIASSASRMDKLIQDVLVYSRVLRADLNLEPVDVEKLVRGILESYPDFQQSNAEVIIEGRLPTVLGNEAGLTQCFSNLLNNAVKFVRPETRPRVRMSCEPRGQRVRIWVADNGIGIDPQYASKIFGMFQRLSTTYEGTGIGLTIVRKAAERMGGTAGVESNPGQGSRFWLELKSAEGN